MVGLLATSKKDLYQHMPPRTAASCAPVAAAGPFQPTPLQETLQHTQAGLAQSCGVTALFLWVLAHTRFCALQEPLFPPVLWEFWNQTHCLSKSDSLGSLFARSPDWEV